MRVRKLLLVIFGALFALVSFGFLAGGTVSLWAHTTQRDPDGYYQSSAERLSTPGYALVSPRMDTGGADWAPFGHIGTVRVQATAGRERQVFVGVARLAEVDRYLVGVRYDEVSELPYGPLQDLAFRSHNTAGDATPAAPGSQAFWLASASGAGPQTVTWRVEGTDWAVVVMNADASRDVTVDVAVGVNTGWLLPIAFVLFGLALLTGTAAAAMLVVGLRAAPAPAPAEEAVAAPLVAAALFGPGTYPARLDAHPDFALKRWLWLVKWFLAIPHLVVLAFLWMAFAVLTVVAGFSILFTGRYPRRIFDFNVGVIRWTWRVTFYAFVLGTDRYPPFSLARDLAYPADFDVDYPASLSRPLVLVKWWLLAIPHYVIVGLFGGGAMWAWGAGRDRTAALGMGLIGVLTLVAAVFIVLRRRYPDSVLDFVMGMERWTHRVLVYAALMRDEYPPFRLDNGGTDPGTMPAAPPHEPPSAPPAPPTDDHSPEPVGV